LIPIKSAEFRSGIVSETLGENAMPQIVAAGVGLAGTVAFWFLGMLIASGFGPG